MTLRILHLFRVKTGVRRYHNSEPKLGYFVLSYFVIQVILVHIRYELIYVCQDILQPGCVNEQSRLHRPWGSQQEEVQHRLVRHRESRAVHQMAEEKLRT